MTDQIKDFLFKLLILIVVSAEVAAMIFATIGFYGYKLAVDEHCKAVDRLSHETQKSAKP